MLVPMEVVVGNMVNLMEVVVGNKFDPGIIVLVVIPYGE